LCQETQPYDKADAASWDRMIEQIHPLLPADRLQAPDMLAPGRVLQELTEFVAAEAGLGRAVARQLVEEVISLRHICCPRARELKPYEMPLIVTHVSARLSEEMTTRFRQLAPVIITVWTPEELEQRLNNVPGFLEQLKRRIVRVCFEAYRQNGLLTLMELQWIFQISAARISELIRSVQKEHNLIVPIPGTILDAGRSMTHKDVIVGLHLEGYTVREIARMTHHSPRAVDNYVGTFEGVLILYMFGVAPRYRAEQLLFLTLALLSKQYV
jgi:predicted DNA-binding protein